MSKTVFGYVFAGEPTFPSSGLGSVGKFQCWRMRSVHHRLVIIHMQYASRDKYRDPRDIMLFATPRLNIIIAELSSLKLHSLSHSPAIPLRICIVSARTLSTISAAGCMLLIKPTPVPLDLEQLSAQFV